MGCPGHRHVRIVALLLLATGCAPRQYVHLYEDVSRPPGRGPDCAIERVSEFDELPHRCELVGDALDERGSCRLEPSYRFLLDAACEAGGDTVRFRVVAPCTAVRAEFFVCQRSVAHEAAQGAGYAEEP